MDFFRNQQKDKSPVQGKQKVEVFIVSIVKFARSNAGEIVSILEAPNISIFEKMAYITISSHVTKTGPTYWPSYAVIARKASMALSKAREVVYGLSKKGLVIRRIKINRTSDGTRIYSYSNMILIFPYTEPFNEVEEIITNEGEVLKIDAAGNTLK